MKKRIIAAITFMAMTMSPLSALAYDESGVTNYLENCINTYDTVKKAEDGAIEILTALQDDYSCTKEEAEAFYEDFLKKVEEKNKKDEPGTDEKNNDNTGDDTKQDEAPKYTLKKGTQSKMQILSQLGIIEDENFDYTGTVTRAKFSEYIANLVNYGNDYSEEEGHYSFNDVTPDMECYHAVASLINKGAVEGVGGGIFEPESAMTLNWACGIMVRLLGYDFIRTSYDDKNESYYINKAAQKDLLKGISAVAGGTVNGEDVCILLYNMLDADSVVMTDLREVNDTTSFLQNTMKLSYADGIVTANSKTSLYSKDGAVADDYLKIGDNNYVFGDVMTTSGLDELLGKKVRVYYDAEDEITGKAVTVLDDYTETFTIEAKDIERYDDSLNRLYYTQDDSGKEKYIEILKSTNIIFNGVAVDYDHIKKQIFMPHSGEITFINNDRKSGYDVALIKSYVYYKVGIVNADDPVLYDEFKIQPNISLDDDRVEMTKDGIPAVVSELAKDMLLMVAPSRVTFKDGVMYVDDINSTYVSVELISNNVSGKLNGNKSGNEIKIGEKTYELSDTFDKLNEKFPDNVNFKMPPMGASVTAGLDKYNSIVFFTVVSYSEGLKYGYIVKVTQDEENDDYIVKVFTQDNEMLKLGFADKVSVHKKWDGGKLSTSSYYAKKLKKESVAVIDGGSFNARPVRFNVNKDNKINELYIADDSNAKTSLDGLDTDLDFFVDNNVFMMNFSNVSTGGPAENWRFRWFNSNHSNGVYLLVPKDASAPDEDYKAYSGNIAYDLPSVLSNMEFYDSDEAGNIRLYVRYSASAVGKTGKQENTSTAIVAEKPSKSYDTERDEITYTIKLFSDFQATHAWRIGKFQTYSFEDSELESYAVTSEEKFKNLSNIQIEDLEPGDIIQFSKNSETGKISGFCVLAKDLGTVIQDTGKPEMGYWYVATAPLNTQFIDRTNGTNKEPGVGIVKGIVEKSVNNSVFYVNDGSKYYNKLRICANTYSRDKVVIYDKKASKNQVTEGAFSDIRVGDYVVAAFDESLVVVRNYN